MGSKTTVIERGEAMLSMQSWIVIRTRSRWEKKVALVLREKGIETFCPVVRERRQWSDRIKIIERPLLTNYLLVRIHQDQRTLVRLTEGVVNFVYRKGRPLAIKEKLVEQIRRFQQAHPFLSAMPTPVQQLNGVTPNTKQSTLDIEQLNIVLVAGTARPCRSHAAPDKFQSCVSSHL